MNDESIAKREVEQRNHDGTPSTSAPVQDGLATGRPCEGVSDMTVASRPSSWATLHGFSRLWREILIFSLCLSALVLVTVCVAVLTSPSDLAGPKDARERSQGESEPPGLSVVEDASASSDGEAENAVPAWVGKFDTSVPDWVRSSGSALPDKYREESYREKSKELAIRSWLANEHPRDAKAQRELADACERLGDMALQSLVMRVDWLRGDGAVSLRGSIMVHRSSDAAAINDALAYYKRALRTRRDLASFRPGDAVAQRELAKSYERLARITEGVVSLKYYKDGLEVRRKLADSQPDDDDAKCELAAAYEFVGTVTRRLARNPWASSAEREEMADRAALEYYKEGLEVRRKLAESKPDDLGAQSDLAKCYDSLGDMMKGLGDFSDAVKYYQGHLEIKRKLAASEPDDFKAQLYLADSYARFGSMMEQSDDPDEAVKYYQSELDIRANLAESKPDDFYAQNYLADCYARLGSTMERLGDPNKAVRHYQSQLDTRTKLAASKPDNSRAQYKLADCYVRLGSAMEHLGDLKESVKCYHSDLEVRTKLAESKPDDWEAQRDLANSYVRLGSMMERLGDADNAVKYYQADLEIRTELAESKPDDLKAQRELAISKERLQRPDRE